jgi:homoserine dehydrogenase
MFYGRGAGKLPTASAVVADVIDAARHLVSRKFIDWDDDKPGFVAPTDDMEYRFYVRTDWDTAQYLTEALPGAEIVDQIDGETCVFTPSVVTAELQKLLAGHEIDSLIRIL